MRRLKASFWLGRNDDLVDQRIAQPRHLHERPAVATVPSLQHPVGLTAGSSKDADRRRRRSDAGRVDSARGQVSLRDLDRDRVDVLLLERVDARSRRHVRQEGRLERPQVAEIKDRAEVNVEALGPLTREDRVVGRQGVHGRVGQRGVVVRGRRRTDVARRARQARAERARRRRRGPS